jgi:hypothetical protein
MLGTIAWLVYMLHQVEVTVTLWVVLQIVRALGSA